MKQPQFSDSFPEAVIREGADELTSMAIDMKHIEVERWGTAAGCELARVLSGHLQRN